jgi:hypothetical protein
MSARPRAQDAETILGVVVGYSLDETCQHFPGVRLWTHADHRISRFTLVPPAHPFSGLIRRESFLLCLWFET